MTTDGHRKSKVCLVMVTYNRYDILVETIASIDQQERNPDYFYVVDNFSSDGTYEKITQRNYSNIQLIRMSSNDGYGAAAAVGMKQAMIDHPDVDYFWIMDDDSRPSPSALKELLAAYDQLPGRAIGIVGLVGFDFTVGSYKPHHRSTELKNSQLSSVDFVLMDGSLVSKAAVLKAGVYREDYFMIGEDYEYCCRMKAHAFDVMLLLSDTAKMDRLILGGGGKFTRSNIWRGYYQARNQFHIMKTYPSAGFILRYFLRETKVLTASLLAPNRFTRIYYRLKGFAHGVRGISGRTVEPFK